MKRKLVLIFGGKSVEHDISIITALQTLKFFPNEIDCLPIYIDKNGSWWVADNLNDIKIYRKFFHYAKNLKRVSILSGTDVLLVEKKEKFLPYCQIDVVVNCCHGNVGEDGSLQGMLKTCGIACTSSGVTSSAICMDKIFMKDILKANKIDSVEYVKFDKCAYVHEKKKIINSILKTIKFPLIVKPANLGSSIGISVCQNQEEFFDAVEFALQFDERILVEKYVENAREFNCACFVYKGNFFVSSVCEVKNKDKIFSFDDKYCSKTIQTQKLEKTLEFKVKKLTEKVYKLLNCQGVVRVDFLFDTKTNKLLVNEVNTIPGSLAFYLFKDIAFKDLLLSIIEQARFDKQEKNDLIVSYDSDALKIFEEVKFLSKK